MQPGELFGGRFLLEQRAGAGGMGTVYRGRDEATGAPVAIKLLNDDDLDSIRRFTHEARILSEIGHPHVVRYIAHGATAAGRPYLVMEWLEGEDLAERLARAPLRLEETQALSARVAAALAAAHAACVVHRDLKPSNLFLVG